MSRILRGYSKILNEHKYKTQIVTGGVLWCSGDLLCQSLVHLAGSGDDETAQNKLNSDGDPPSFIDWKRTATMTLYGIGVSAPACAIWYTQLERLSQRVFASQPPGTSLSTPIWVRRLLAKHPIALKPVQNFIMASDSRARLRTWKIIGFKLAMDTFVFDPVYLTLFFSVTSAMEGRGPSHIWAKLKEDLGTTWLVDIAIWSPIQTFNFRFVPVLYQALVVQSCNIVWNAYLSFVQHRSVESH